VLGAWGPGYNVSEGAHTMDLIQRALTGIATVEAGASVQRQAAEHLRHWLTDDAFAAYRPQLAWLIETQRWAGLLDRFYQVLPFGTGGRRGAVGVGPNRFNAWTLASSVQGHCEYLRERFPARGALRVVIAYDVRQFEDRNKQYNAALPNPVLHVSSRRFAHEAACVYAANGITAHVLPEHSKRYLATPELSYTVRVLEAHGGPTFPRRTIRRTTTAASSTTNAADSPCRRTIRSWPIWRRRWRAPRQCRGTTRCAPARSASSTMGRTARTSSCRAARASSRHRASTS
jgi:hypothetical protein